MKEIRNSALLGVASLALFVLFLFLGVSGGWDIKLVIMSVAMLGGTAFFAWETYSAARVIIRSRKEREQWNKAELLELDMPFPVLAERFRKLAAGDELAVAEPGFLSWNTGQFASIRISRLGDSDWLAIYWLQADWHYTDTQLGRICKAEKVELPAEFKKSKPQGIAVCRAGSLSIYPVPRRQEWEAAFMDNIFLPDEEAYNRWLEDYLAEG